MNATEYDPGAAVPRQEPTAFRSAWLWFVLLGAALTVVGVIALGSLVIASLATAVAIGGLLLMGGTAETVSAFWIRDWRGENNAFSAFFIDDNQLAHAQGIRRFV